MIIVVLESTIIVLDSVNIVLENANILLLSCNTGECKSSNAHEYDKSIDCLV